MQQLNEFWTYAKESMNFSQNGDWITQVGIVVLLVMTASFAASTVLKRLEKQCLKTDNIWDDAIVASLRPPVRTLVWVIGIGFAANIVAVETQTTLFSGVAPVRDVCVIAVIGWFLIRLIGRVSDNLEQERTRKSKSYDKTTAYAVCNILRATVVVTSALVSLQTLGFSVSGVLAFGGVGGVAVGFAARDLLANFFGAVMIYLDKPFKIGDWVRSPDKEIEGTVEKIGFRQTVVRTFDKRPLYIPNSVFANIIVENPSRMTHRRIYETIGIRYDDIAKMSKITDEVRNMLINHKAIDESQTLMVNFNAFNASSCDFFIYTFTHTTVWVEFHAIKHELLLAVSDIIKKHGAEIAYPTQTLHVLDGDAPLPAGKASTKNTPTKKKAA